MKKFWLFLLAPLLGGGLAALLAGGMADYGSFAKPPLSPPGWVFPVVWSVLYLAMGYASYRVYSRGQDAGTVRSSLILYAAQLLINYLWPVVFFRFDAYLAAFIVLIVLWVLVVVTLWQFCKSDERAGDLMIPYLLWVTFAAYLNLGVYLLNP